MFSAPTGLDDRRVATSIATHIYHEFDVEHFNVTRFTHAVNALIARHEMLRARVLPDGTQQILAQVPAYQLEQRDLSALSPTHETMP